MEVITIIVFLVAVAGAQESGLKGPENTLSVVGSNVTLKCLSPTRNCNGTDWMKYTRGGSMVTQSIFKGPGTMLSVTFVDRDRYSVDNSSGCDLVIKNVQLKDAGRFICSTIISSSQVTKSANLIVLNTQPKCMTNASENNTAEGDRIQLTCEATYNGTNNASMVWKGVTDAPSSVKNGNTINRPYSVVASEPEVPSFICEASFAYETDDNGKPIEGLATNNIPIANCSTSAIRVLYSVRNVTLFPSLAVYAPGTNITCAADGYPTPNITWQVMEEELNATWEDIPNATHQLSIFTSNVTFSQYRCVATNVVRGKLYTVNSSTFQIMQSDKFYSIWTKFSDNCLGVGFDVCTGIGSGIGFLVVVLLASILVVVIRRRNQDSHPNPANAKLDDDVQQMEEEIIRPSFLKPSSVSLPPIPKEEPPLVEDQNPAYPSTTVGLHESVYSNMSDDIQRSTYSSLRKEESAFSNVGVDLQESAYTSFTTDKDPICSPYEPLGERWKPKTSSKPIYYSLQSMTRDS